MDVGIYCPDLSVLNVFDKERRCKLCTGEADYKFREFTHWMAGKVGNVMFRRCEDCNFEWVERLESTTNG